MSPAGTAADGLHSRAMDPQIHIGCSGWAYKDWKGAFYPADLKDADLDIHRLSGEIVVGRKPGREDDAERILFWHRGLATTDVAVGSLLLERARERGIGTMLRYR